MINRIGHIVKAFEDNMVKDLIVDLVQKFFFSLEENGYLLCPVTSLFHVIIW
jgi:hypothetical protein